MNHELDKILGRHSVHFNYSKAETRQKLENLINKSVVEGRIDELVSGARLNTTHPFKTEAPPLRGLEERSDND